jgi:hypothetical protein
MLRARTIRVLLFSLCCHEAIAASTVELLPEERVVSDSRNYDLSRNTNHSMVVGRDGTVHLVFWDDAYLDTSPAHPSTVWYCRRDPSGRWRSPEIVDDSYTTGETRVGGRHPSLVLRSNDEVRVFWHDYRNCTAARKWMDNTEIYMDTRPAAGAFSPNDVRLTTTWATHDGDNGYVPQAILSPTGEIYVAWYDYHFDRNLGDVFLMKSDSLGCFNLAAPIESQRLTNASQRADGVSYTFPDLALDASGTVHLVWTRDSQGGYGVYYARLKSGSPLTPPIVLSATGGDFYDPPHITASPRGDVYVLWTEHGSSNGDSDIVVARLRRGAAVFDAPAKISGNLSDQSHGDLKVDSRGLLHAVWVDGRSGHDEVFAGVFDFDGKTLLSEIKTSENPADALPPRPAIALDQNNSAYIAWTDYRSGRGSIYFRAVLTPTGVRMNWNLYR